MALKEIRRKTTAAGCGMMRTDGYTLFCQAGTYIVELGEHVCMRMKGCCSCLLKFRVDVRMDVWIDA